MKGLRRGNATTLQDVAEEAGVSCMVASVVLNGAKSTTRVSDATRARIEEAGARLKYRRNAAALGLSRRKMDTVGVVATIDGGELNLYILELLNGILESAAAFEQNTTVFAIKSWHEEEHRLLQFCDGRIDGLVLIAPALSESIADQLPHHIPLVVINSTADIPYAHNIDVDNVNGAYQVVRYLTQMGHRKILHISGGEHYRSSADRTRGYYMALEEAGIPHDPDLVIHGNFSINRGKKLMNDWLADGKALPTAIFCASDAIAAGCLEALTDNGIRVPGQVSVVGFDDTLAARLTTPPLTTVKQPFREMGRRSVELVLEQIRADQCAHEVEPVENDSNDAAMKTEEFQASLIVRQSASAVDTPV